MCMHGRIVYTVNSQINKMLVNKCTVMMAILTLFVFTYPFVYCASGFESVVSSTKHVPSQLRTIIVQTNLQHCMDNCYRRPACVGISYSRQMKLCDMKIADYNNLTNAVDLEKDPGYVFVRKQKEMVRM